MRIGRRHLLRSRRAAAGGGRRERGGGAAQRPARGLRDELLWDGCLNKEPHHRYMRGKSRSLVSEGSLGSLRPPSSSPVYDRRRFLVVCMHARPLRHRRRSRNLPRRQLGAALWLEPPEPRVSSGVGFQPQVRRPPALAGHRHAGLAARAAPRLLTPAALSRAADGVSRWSASAEPPRALTMYRWRAAAALRATPLRCCSAARTSTKTRAASPSWPRKRAWAGSWAAAAT